MLTRMNHWEHTPLPKSTIGLRGYSGTIRCIGITVPESLDMELPVLPEGWFWQPFMRMRAAKEGPPRNVIYWRSDAIIHFGCFCLPDVWATREENCPLKIIKAAAEQHAQQGKLKGRDWLEQWINLLDR